MKIIKDHPDVNIISNNFKSQQQQYFNNPAKEMKTVEDVKKLKFVDM